MTLPQIIKNGLAPVTPPPAVPGLVEQILNVTPQPQMIDNWCWAAVGLMVRSAYRDPAQLLCEIAEEVLRQEKVIAATASCCPVDTNNDCNSPNVLPPALGTHLDANAATSKTPEFIIGSIKSGHPVAVRIEWPGTTDLNGLPAGHFVLITGYRTNKNDNTNVTLHVCDPRYSQRQEHSFQEFLARYETRGTWDLTFATKGTAVGFEKNVGA
jgi:hypothetical protein